MRLIGVVMIASVALAACGKSDRTTVDAGRIDAGLLREPDAAQMPDAAPPDAPALGVSDGTYLDEMTTDQANDLCTWEVAIQGGPHTIDCGDKTMVTIDPVADCLDTPWPHCQVGLYRPCIEAQAQDECANAPAACVAFYQCAGGG